MNSFLEKMINVFFENTERTVKPLAYAQIMVFICAPYAWNHFAVMYFLLGTGFLLMGMESFIIKGNKSKDYLIGVFCGLLFYWIAIDYYFFY